MTRVTKLVTPLTPEQQRLVRQCYPIAQRTARVLGRAGVSGQSYEDLLSVANEVILAAVATFDATKGPLEAYVWLRVHGALLNARAASTRWHESVERGINDCAITIKDTSDVFSDSEETLRAGFSDLCDDLVTTLDVSTGGHAWHTGGEEGFVLRDEQVRTITQMHDEIAGLPGHLAQILKLRYFDEQSIDQVAAATGLSPQKVVRLLTEAVRLLRARLKGRGIKR